MRKLFRNQIPLLLGICMLGACASPDVPLGIPEFSMVMPATDQVFHSKDIPAGKPSIIFWFDPNCRDCQEEAEHILAEMEKFRNFNIYMITRHAKDELMVFYNHLRLDTCENILVGIDQSGVIPRTYKVRGTPLTLTYNENLMLTGVFSGMAAPKDLLKVINKKL